MALVHLVGKIRIAVSANRVCLHDFWRANFPDIARCNPRTGDPDVAQGSELSIRGASGDKRQEGNGRQKFHGSLGLLEDANDVENPTLALPKSMVCVT
jgi:hypothetical protein